MGPRMTVRETRYHAANYVALKTELVHSDGRHENIYTERGKSGVTAGKARKWRVNLKQSPGPPPKFDFKFY